MAERSFIKNTSITLITRIVSLALGIVISILLARILGPENRGIYALIILIPSFAFMFSNMGVNASTVFFIGKGTYSANKVAGNNLVISSLIGLFAIGLTILFLYFFGSVFFSEVPFYAYVIVIIAIPFLILNSNLSSLFLGMHRFLTYNLLTFLGTFIQFILLLGLYIASAFELSNVIYMYLVSAVTIFIITIIVTKRSLKKITINFKEQYLKNFFSYGSKSYLGNVVNFLHLRIDQLIISSFLNPLAIGLYAIAVGLTERLWLLAESAATVLFPRISSEKNEEEKNRFTPILCRNILFVTAVGAVALFLISKWLILLFYSNEYLGSLLPFQILLLGTLFVSGSKIIANDLAGRGMPMSNTNVNIITLIINVILNLILIPKFGIAGAAYATTISYSIAFFARSIIYKKVSGNSLLKIMIVQKDDWKLYRALLLKFFRKSKKQDLHA